MPNNDPEPTLTNSQTPKHDHLPATPPSGTYSLFLKEDFRDHLCHCSACFPNLIPHPQLREEEETYEPPLSEEGDGDDANNGGGSHHTGSLLDRGEAALSNVDRVRAIEGVMVYNHLRDKVKEFLKPFAESGQPVSAEDIKAYFEKLRGDDQAIKEAGGRASASASAPAPVGEKMMTIVGAVAIWIVVPLIPEGSRVVSLSIFPPARPDVTFQPPIVREKETAKLNNFTFKPGY